MTRVICNSVTGAIEAKAAPHEIEIAIAHCSGPDRYDSNFQVLSRAGYPAVPRNRKQLLVASGMVLVLHAVIWMLLTERYRPNSFPTADTYAPPLVLRLPPFREPRQTVLDAVPKGRRTPVPKTVKTAKLSEVRKPVSSLITLPASSLSSSPASSSVSSSVVPENSPEQRSTSPLDYDALKRSARSIARERHRPASVDSIETLPQHEVFSRQMEKAARQDCERAHSHLGLLAIPLLLRDTVTDKGCKW